MPVAAMGAAVISTLGCRGAGAQAAWDEAAQAVIRYDRVILPRLIRVTAAWGAADSLLISIPGEGEPPGPSATDSLGTWLDRILSVPLGPLPPMDPTLGRLATEHPSDSMLARVLEQVSETRGEIDAAAELAGGRVEALMRLTPDPGNSEGISVDDPPSRLQGSPQTIRDVRDALRALAITIVTASRGNDLLVERLGAGRGRAP